MIRMQYLTWISTLGGIGYLPISGFFSIILGGLWMHFLKQRFRYWKWVLGAQIVFAIILTTLSPTQGSTDPSAFVIDEFVASGILLLAFDRLSYIFAGIGLFSILDMVKPLARYVEHLPGGLGIVCDDIVSASFATLLIILVRYLAKRYNIYRSNDKE